MLEANLLFKDNAECTWSKTMMLILIIPNLISISNWKYLKHIQSRRQISYEAF